MSEPYTTADGRILYRWENDGQRWACCEYDHSPFCRRCVRVDDVMDALLQHVVDGLALVRPRPANADPVDFDFKLTDEGMRQAGHLIRTITDDPLIDAIRDEWDSAGGEVSP